MVSPLSVKLMIQAWNAVTLRPGSSAAHVRKAWKVTAGGVDPSAVTDDPAHKVSADKSF